MYNLIAARKRAGSWLSPSSCAGSTWDLICIGESCRPINKTLVRILAGLTAYVVVPTGGHVVRLSQSRNA